MLAVTSRAGQLPLQTQRVVATLALQGTSCHTGSCQHHIAETTEHSNPHLAAAQLPYSLPTGKPGPGLTEVMSGFSRDANCPAVQVKSLDVPEVSSAMSSGCFCRLGVGSTKSWATTYTLYNVPAVIPHDPACVQCEKVVQRVQS